MNKRTTSWLNSLSFAAAVVLVASCASGLGWRNWTGQQFAFAKPSTLFAAFDIPVVDHPDSSWAASIATRLLYRLPDHTLWVVEDMRIIDDHDGFIDGFVVRVGPGAKPELGRIRLGGDALLWIGTRGRAQLLAGYQ